MGQTVRSYIFFLFGFILIGSLEIRAIPSPSFLNNIHDLPTEIKKIKESGKLRVAMHAVDHPPFFMKDEDGIMIGLDVELAQEIAKLLDVTLEINRDSQSFDEVVYHVSRGDADIGISKLSLTFNRALMVRYTKPYIVMRKALLLNRMVLTKFNGEISVKTLFDQKGSKIGAMANSSYANFGRSLFPNADIIEDTSWPDKIIPRLMRGEIWAAFRDELEVHRSLSFKDAPLYLLAVNLKEEQDPIMMVVHKDHGNLQEFLDLYLTYGYQKRELKDVIKKYNKYIKI